ncbi:hypothetical protein [Kitasatospora sp. NPDC093102]|uniref:hypothetical protein n=1 Tax=Kitasatospora sp. NPDC093102 TaxID=3155069 RepID=UPI003424A46E
MGNLQQELAARQGAISEPGHEPTEAARDRPLPGGPADTRRAEGGRRRHARQALLEAIARHHHGPCQTGNRTAGRGDHQRPGRGRMIR